MLRSRTNMDAMAFEAMKIVDAFGRQSAPVNHSDGHCLTCHRPIVPNRGFEIKGHKYDCPWVMADRWRRKHLD